MKRALALCVALASLAALAAGLRGADLGVGIRPGGLSRAIDPSRGAAAPISALFYFLPDAGTGAPLVTDLCDALDAGDKAGAWRCTKGDGTAATGSTGSMSRVGNAAVESRAYCPSGLNCTARSATAMPDNTSYIRTSSTTTAPSGDFSACVLAQVDETAAAYDYAPTAKSDEAGDYVWLTECVASGGSGCRAYFRDADATTCATAVGTVLPTVRVPHLLCVTYVRSTGTFALRAHDGAAAIGSSTCTVTAGDAPRANNNRHLVVRGFSGLAAYTGNARVYGELFTEKELSAADIARLALAALGTAPTGAAGEALTFARASTVTCDNGAGAVTVLPNNKPCVAQYGLLASSAGTNLALRSEELSHAAWADVGTPATAADGQVAPDGSKTGDTLTDNDGAALEGEAQAVTTATQSSYTLSCWLKSGTATTASMSMAGTGNADGDATCTFSGLSAAAWARKSCPTSAAYGAGLSAVTVTVAVGDSVDDTGTLHVWGCQLEAKDRPTSYVRTEASTVTRATGRASFVKPTGVGNTAGCMAADVLVAGVTAGARVLDWNAGYSYLQSSTVGRSYDGTNTVSATAASPILDRAVRLLAEWSGSEMTTTHDGVLATGSYDGSLTGATLFVGSTTTPDNHLDGFIGNVRVSDGAGECTP